MTNRQGQASRSRSEMRPHARPDGCGTQRRRHLVLAVGGGGPHVGKREQPCWRAVWRFPNKLNPRPSDRTANAPGSFVCSGPKREPPRYLPPVHGWAAVRPHPGTALCNEKGGTIDTHTPAERLSAETCWGKAATAEVTGGGSIRRTFLNDRLTEQVLGQRWPGSRRRWELCMSAVRAPASWLGCRTAAVRAAALGEAGWPCL